MWAASGFLTLVLAPAVLSNGRSSRGIIDCPLGDYCQRLVEVPSISVCLSSSPSG